jgi:hypothetical protein
MKLMKTLSAGVAAIAITTAFSAVVAPTPAHAQQTTSAIRGTVTDEAGAPVPGATVVIANTNTGTSRTVTTDNAGSFFAPNLSVSGSYTVTATASGYQGKAVEGVGLAVGETAVLSFGLASSSATSDEIVVVATRTALAEVATGPSAVFDASDLANLPAVNRDIKDIVRLDPRINIDESYQRGIRCVGSNERFNSLTIDGIRQNDIFGLNDNGYPTQRLPFPFDVAEQVAVEIAPVDVEYGGFTGCNINVVTKSGSNEFHGRGFLDYQLAGLNGNSLEGDPVSKPDTDEKSFGGVLTGPIIKDRLFFTAAYEKFTGTDTYITGPAGGGFVNEVEGVTVDDVSRVQQIMQDVYGFNAGGIPSSTPDTDARWYVKLDAYITDNHRIELSYQDTYGEVTVSQGTSTAFNELGLSSNWYKRSEDMEVYSGRIFSDWTDQFSTEVMVSYLDRITGQESLYGTDFAQMEIATAGGGTIFLGPDPNRHANKLNGSSLNIKVKGQYILGDHVFKGGYERETYDFFNLYIFGAEGIAEYDSIDDLEALMPSRIQYTNAGTNNEDDAGASFKRTLNTLYLQDQWSPDGYLTVTGGLRYDFITMSDAPAFNQIVVDRFGVANDETFDGLSLLQPRVGLEYSVNDRLNISLGAGRFSGGDPSVWLSNSFSNTGFNTGFTSSTDGAVINGFDGYELPAAMQAAVAAAASAGTGPVNLVDPDYKMSSIWRFTAGAKYTADLGPLGEDWLFGVDFLYNIQQNPNVWQNLDLAVIDTAPDGRPIYNTQYGYGSNGVLMLTNADASPKTKVFSGYVDKAWQAGIFEGKFYAGYAYTDAEDVSPATSSTAASNYENIAVSDFNFPAVATSNYEIKHAFTARADFAAEFVGELKTRLSFIGQLNSGKPYSYTFDTNGGSDAIAGGANLFGDSDDSERRSLLYVPTGPSDPLVDFSGLSASQVTDLFNFFQEVGLDKFAGGIAPRNAFNSDWWGKVDLRFEQELPGLRNGDRLRLILDIDNLTNLINDDWGVYREVVFGNSGHTLPIIESEISPDGTQFVFTDVDLDRYPQDIIYGVSVWSINLGVRYDF